MDSLFDVFVKRVLACPHAYCLAHYNTYSVADGNGHQVGDADPVAHYYTNSTTHRDCHQGADANRPADAFAYQAARGNRRRSGEGRGGGKGHLPIVSWTVR